jgi:BirA family biotin operon repressor/biotin-[acetyl-CoA-carboxylase] ligase
MNPRALTADDLLGGAPLARLGAEVRVFREIDSTNAFLLANARQLSDGAIAYAEFQSAGRGRLGRRWTAPAGTSIQLSVLLKEPAASPLIAEATSIAAVAAREAIVACTSCAPGIRWPNDIVLGGRKLGGVLAEASPSSGGTDPGCRHSALVIGIGINCLQQPHDFPVELRGTATSIAIAQRNPSRAALAASLIAALDRWIVGCGAAEAGNKLRQAWRAACCDVGTDCVVQHDGERFEGTILDIAPDGDLIVGLAHGKRRRFPAATTTRLWPAASCP